MVFTTKCFLLIASICLQRTACHRTTIRDFNLSKHSNIKRIDITSDGALHELSCYSKGRAGIWDYPCWASFKYGILYNLAYCTYFKKFILSNPNGPVNDHCADAFDFYCKAISAAGIWHHTCTAGCGGLCKRRSDGHDYNALCGLKGGSIADWLVAKPGHKNAYHQCMKKGPKSFCRAVKLEGKYEADCVDRITHRDRNDDYCTCQRLGSPYYDGVSRTYRCNEKQDPSNPMDMWDNECLRTCYSSNTLGWMCTPTNPISRKLPYKGNLKAFGHRPGVLDDIKKIETAKRKGQPVSMGYDGQVHVVRDDSPEAIAVIKAIEKGESKGLTIKMNGTTGNPTFHKKVDGVVH